MNLITYGNIFCRHLMYVIIIIILLPKSYLKLISKISMSPIFCKHMAIIIDPDRRMLSVIENKAKEKGFTNIELIQDYIENLSIQNHSVDFVMASLILHEVSSLTTVLKNIFEVLKTGGYL